MEKHKAIISDPVHIEELHRETQKLISSLHFTQDELKFIEKLLQSYVFEPNTPNLFERLQDYLRRLELTKVKLKELNHLIVVYETELDGLLQSHGTDEKGESEKKYNQLKILHGELQEKFKMLKSEIFNYAGGILKKRRK